MSYWRSRFVSTAIAIAVVVPLTFLGLNMWLALLAAVGVAMLAASLINKRLDERRS
jgi:hypothetical protein